MTVGIYARVSTKEVQEHGLASQVHSCREFLKAKGLPLEDTIVFQDQASGRRADRSGLRDLTHRAAMKQVKVVVVYKLDKLTRGGIAEMFHVVKTLYGYGVRIYSVSEVWWDPENPTYDLILAVLAWVAEFESRSIGEQVAAGIAARRAEAGGGGSEPGPTGWATSRSLTVKPVGSSSPWRGSRRRSSGPWAVPGPPGASGGGPYGLTGSWRPSRKNELEKGRRSKGNE